MTIELTKYESFKGTINIYKLTNKNCGPNSLHGGPEGFQNQNWNSEIIDNKVVFSYLSKNGEENFPGNVIVNVTYEWTDNNTLIINYYATTDEDTVLNLTNHTYFNLKGYGNGNIFDHILKLNCKNYLPTDDTLVPTGDFTPVEGTPMDFTKGKPLGQDINSNFQALKTGKGYDHCWLVDNYENGELKNAPNKPQFPSQELKPGETYKQVIEYSFKTTK